MSADSNFPQKASISTFRVPRLTPSQAETAPDSDRILPKGGGPGRRPPPPFNGPRNSTPADLQAQRAPLADQPAAPSSAAPRKTLRIYTDGACTGNPGPGGWAYVIMLDGEIIHSRSGHCCAHTTNIEMEMTAVVQALRDLRTDRPGTVYSDLANLPKGMNEWLRTWEKNGWRNSKGKPVAHRPIWEELKALRDARGPGAKITFAWIKGHAGHPGNEEADRLAQTAAAVASRSALLCRTRFDADTGLMIPLS